MLRGIRFATRLQFAIADETLEGMSRMAPRIEIISQERVTDELMKSMETAAAPSLTWKLSKDARRLRECMRAFWDTLQPNTNCSVAWRPASRQK